MNITFISSASEDRYFVDLLIELLKYHHVHCLYASDGTSEKLEQADNLIVVISDHTTGSGRETREIVQFHSLKPAARIIPILLSPVSPHTASDLLKQYQPIYFYQNMLEGARSLFKLFGKDFLPPVERRNHPERRFKDRRNGDRRRHSVSQRLRYGLWRDYEKLAGLGQGKFDIFEGSSISLGHFTRALTPKPGEERVAELSRYDFMDRETGQAVNMTSELIEQNLHRVLNDLRQEFTVIKNVYITDMLAERLAETYEVKPHDQRKQDRRVQSDRRMSQMRTI